MTRVHIRQGDLTAFDADVAFVLFDERAADIFGETWDRISDPEG